MAYASGRTCLSELRGDHAPGLLVAGNPHPSPTMGLFCRYGMAYVLHRLPAAANIIMTQEYLDFAQQVISSHDRANKQAEMDVSPAVGDMLTEMQGCLKQLCGSSVAGDPEAMAQLIAEKVAAMNISPGPNSEQDSDGDVLALPAPAQVPAPEVHVDPSAEAQACTTGMIQAPPLYSVRQKSVSKTSPCLAEQFVCDDSSI